MMTIFTICKKIRENRFNAMSELPVSFKLPAAIGARLRELREAKNLSRPVLAKRMTLSDAQLRQIEENETSLFYSEAIRIAAARKVADFLGEPLIFHAAEQTTPKAKDAELQTSSVAVAMDTPAAPEVAPVMNKPTIEARVQTEVVALSQTINATEVLPAEITGETGRVFALSPLVRWGAALLVLLLIVDITLWLVGDGKALPASTAVTSPAQFVPATSLQVTLPTGPQSPPSAALAPVAVAVAGTELPFPVAGVASTQVAETTCDKLHGPIATFSPVKATKEASLVYVVGTPSQWVCLKDGRGQAWRHVFASSSGQSFYGRPPWLVESPHLDLLQIYFQGVLARPSQANSTRVRLVASEDF